MDEQGGGPRRRRRSDAVRAEAPGPVPRRPVGGVLALLGEGPPFGPTRPGFWRSPLRGPRLTSLLGAVLLVGVPVLFVTGLLSYAAYNPDLASNDMTPDKGVLGFYLFPWPTDPPWLYRLTQGVHVTLGITLVPVLLAKLWSVVPLLFRWPPVRSLAHALERLSVLFLVGGALFVFATGVLNVQLEYVFPGSFYPLHFYGAWVFVSGLVAHVALKLPTMVRALRGRGPGRGPGDASGRGRADDGLVAPDPAPETASRRTLLGAVGLGSLALLLTTVGQSLGGPLRRTAVLAPHGRLPADGADGFPVNTTAAYAGVTDADTGPGWRLTVRNGDREVVLTREELLALPRYRSALPIACVEGWSTRDLDWEGVRLSDLAALVGAAGPPGVLVESAQRSGAFASAALRGNQVADPRSLLALRVNGEDLSPDHGYPARVIVPANPGVHNTKWVTRLGFGEV
ncbi:molybdopterin-dependent oxidoreductase [Nocardiopsis sp. CT-R113]|uniref:Molybdopterin-dependent oxidoreductase n=1 Tax=Nocardiopsis codii TaxID=3065942 RepID=A0ABU7K5X1_9ACTN|nr:molybdopterin-dependent oxidoreductase [Nocardiopsis sp. CT-R113]MEE2037432.1 molybdopterin-dependent oxidoreductase [Nocardiopsis sp. CT-R113]